MIKKRRKQLIKLYTFSDVLAIFLAFVLAFWVRFHSGLVGTAKGVPLFSQYLVILPILLCVQLFYFSYQGFYEMKLRRNRLDDLFLVLWNSMVSSFVILLIFSYLRSYRFIQFEVSHFYLLIYVPLAMVFIFSLRLLMFKTFKNVFLNKNGISRVLIAGVDDLGIMMADKLKKYSHFGIEVCGFLGPKGGDGVLGTYDDFEEVAKRHAVTDLFIALPLNEYQTIMDLIRKGNHLLLDIKLVPDILQIASLKAGMEHVEGIPTINLGDIPLRGYRVVMKRTFDLFACLTGIVCLFPVFVFFIILIKLDSRGSAFYAQNRVGLDGKHFKMFKFRTMVTDAEKETGVIWSPKDDKRITRVGKILRKFSIDELPQLLNVVMGEMSLVGPRPERPKFVEQFKKDIPKYMLRHRVKTGMTGWAQVHGLRQNTPLDKRIEFDIYYIQNWTFKLDLEILWRTLLRFRFIDRND